MPIERPRVRARNGRELGLARAAGDFDTAAVIAGEAVDLIADIPSAAEVIERIAREAEALLAGASDRHRVVPD